MPYFVKDIHHYTNFCRQNVLTYSDRFNNILVGGFPSCHELVRGGVKELAVKCHLGNGKNVDGIFGSFDEMFQILETELNYRRPDLIRL